MAHPGVHPDRCAEADPELNCALLRALVVGPAARPFDLDRLLLNRLYLLAGITAGRRQIHERLAHILTTHEGVHQPKPAATRGYIRTILQRGSDLLSSHLPQVVATSTVLSCAFAIALIWLKVWDCPNWMFSAARILFGLTFLTGVAAFVQALRQKQGQTPEDKQIEKISEMAIELRSELAQINLKVASGYACIDNTPLEATSALSPEGLLREIDEALHIKASFDSLDKVIATQSQNVSSDHKQSRSTACTPTRTSWQRAAASSPVSSPTRWVSRY